MIRIAMAFSALAVVLQSLVFQASSQSAEAASNSATPTHVSNTFRFQVHAPISRAAALFGPEGERSWAGKQWDPKFLYPQPAKDVQGAVFTVMHGPHKSVRVNTIFDLAAGRMQYVCLIPEVMVSTINVKLTSLNASNMAVEVTYVRTALDVSANDTVQAMGKSDKESGVDWQSAIEASLKQEGR